MVGAKGPIKGTRIPVKLPWGAATDKNKLQFVSMKQPVAELLGFDKAKKDELTYETKIKYKDGSTSKEKTVKRYRRPGYRARAIRVEFGLSSTGGKVSKRIGGKSVFSFQFPITKSVAIADVIDFFKDGKGSGLNAARIVEANTGQGYPIK